MDSNSKPTSFECSGPVLDEVEGCLGEEEFGGSFPAERFPGSSVEGPGDVVERVLGEGAQVGAFWKVLAEQAVGAPLWL